MAARGKVHLLLPDGTRMLARTDLTGHGVVSAGTEFLARELWTTGHNRVMKGGRRLRVVVVEVERVHRSYHILRVEIVKDLTPEESS